MPKKFKLGFMVGRFQLLHKGHESLINEGLKLCDRFVILLGNSEESRTKNNPFNFEERKEMIQKIYGDKVEVYPIISIGIGYVPEWGNYIMNTIKYYCGDYPDFVIRGADDGRSQWIDKSKYTQLTEYIISRELIKISASDLREKLKEVCRIKKNSRILEAGGMDSHRLCASNYAGLDLSRSDFSKLPEYKENLKTNLNCIYNEEYLDRLGSILYDCC